MNGQVRKAIPWLVVAVVAVVLVGQEAMPRSLK
jgi:hypothetical protein